MKHYENECTIEENKIILNKELNTDKLGWQHGDIFRFENHNGQQVLVKLDPLEKFVRGYS